MFHETLTLLALIAFMLVIKPAAAADRLVDGVPLPGDAQVATVVETDPAELRQWAGVWVGAWGGTLKHVLLVESIASDGFGAGGLCHRRQSLVWNTAGLVSA